MTFSFPQTSFNVYHQPQTVFVPVLGLDNDGTCESMRGALAAATVVSDRSWCTLLDAGGDAPGFTFALEHRTDIATHFEPRTATIRITIPLPDGSVTATQIVKINQYPATAQVAVAFMRYQTKIVYDAAGKEVKAQAEYAGSPLFTDGGTAYYSPNGIEGKWLRKWTQPKNALSTYLPYCGATRSFGIRAEEQGANVATVPIAELGKSIVAVFASEDTAAPTISYAHNLTPDGEGRVLFFNRTGSAPTIVVKLTFDDAESEVYNGVLPTSGYVEIPIAAECYCQVDVYEGGEHVARAGLSPTPGNVVAGAFYLKTTVRRNADDEEQSSKTEYTLQPVTAASIDSPRTAMSATLAPSCNPAETTFSQDADATSASQYTRAAISDVGSSVGIGDVTAFAETLADWLKSESAGAEQGGLVHVIELDAQAANESSSPRSASAYIALPLDPDRTAAEWRSYSGAWINQNGVRERFLSLSPQWARAEFLGDIVSFSVSWKGLAWTLAAAPGWLKIAGATSGDEPVDADDTSAATFNATISSTAVGSIPVGVIWLSGSWTDKKSGTARSTSVCATLNISGALAPSNAVTLKSAPPSELPASGGTFAALWTTPVEDDAALVAQTNDDSAGAAVSAPAGTTVSATTETGAAADWITVGDTVSAGTGTDDSGNAVNVWKTSFTVAANASDAQRAAAITISASAGATAFAMTQVGVAVDSDDFAVAPAALTFGESGGTKQIAVFAGGAVQATIPVLSTEGAQTNIGNYHGFKFPFKDFATAAGIDKNSFNVELASLRLVIGDTNVPENFYLAVFQTSEIVTDFANALTFGTPTLISTAQRLAEFAFETPPLLDDAPYLFIYYAYERSGTNVAIVRSPVFSPTVAAVSCPLTAYNPVNRAPVFSVYSAKITAVLKITAKIPDADALDWTATPNVDWLHAAPASGKGTAIVDIYCDALPPA